MRVIAGNKRGIKLISPDGKETRPTTDKVREAIFSKAYSFEGWASSFQST
ncbi:MAG: RsmD family RNA methyltransferase [Christensenellaceae bacterium]